MRRWPTPPAAPKIRHRVWPSGRAASRCSPSRWRSWRSSSPCASGFPRSFAGPGHIRRRVAHRRRSRSSLRFAAFVVIWREGTEGLRPGAARPFHRCRAARLSGLPRRAGLPSARHDRRCDRPGDPPRFEAIARLRPRDANPIAYPGLRAAELQRTAYPDHRAAACCQSPPQVAYDVAVDVITSANGASSMRGRRRPAGARADRSGCAHADHGLSRRRRRARALRPGRRAARYALFLALRPVDFGANAERITRCSEEIDESVGNLDAGKAARPEVGQEDRRRAAKP